jgi:hemerythrin
MHYVIHNALKIGVGMNHEFLEKIKSEHQQINAGLNELLQTCHDSEDLQIKIETLSKFVSDHMAMEEQFCSQADQGITERLKHHHEILSELIKGLKESDSANDSWVDLVECMRFIFPKHHEGEEILISKLTK